MRLSAWREQRGSHFWAPQALLGYGLCCCPRHDGEVLLEDSVMGAATLAAQPWPALPAMGRKETLVWGNMTWGTLCSPYTQQSCLWPFSALVLDTTFPDKQSRHIFWHFRTLACKPVSHLPEIGEGRGAQTISTVGFLLVSLSKYAKGAARCYY